MLQEKHTGGWRKYASIGIFFSLIMYRLGRYRPHTMQ